MNNICVDGYPWAVSQLSTPFLSCHLISMLTTTTCCLASQSVSGRPPSWEQKGSTVGQHAQLFIQCEICDQLLHPSCAKHHLRLFDAVMEMHPILEMIPQPATCDTVSADPEKQTKVENDEMVETRARTWSFQPCHEGLLVWERLSGESITGNSKRR